MTPAVGQTVWYVGPETDGAGASREAYVLAVRSESPGARLDLALASGAELLNVAPLHPLNGSGWRWPDPPAAPAPWEREVACPCGEACEVVDYPTGYRSCGNSTPGWKYAGGEAPCPRSGVQLEARS